MVDFYSCCGSGKRNKHFTIYLLTVLMTSLLRHIARQQSLLHGVKDEHWTTLLKNTHFCLDYYSGVSWSIFILFEPMETQMNTLQRINKIYNTNLTVSILPNVKSSHFETTVADHFLECVRSNPLFATFTESHLMLFFIFFVQNFLSVFWQKIFYIFTGF